jgi:hypothetical protein
MEKFNKLPVEGSADLSEKSKLRTNKKFRSKKRGMVSPAHATIVTMRDARMPGFKQFRRATRLQAAALKVEAADKRLDDQGKILRQATFYLQMMYAHLAAFAQEDNWVVKLVHGVKCNLMNPLIVLPDCTCTPLEERIWNGDKNIFESSHKALGAFEKAAMAPGEDSEPATNQEALPQEPTLPTTSALTPADALFSLSPQPESAGQA